ncbi:DNA internalization-related competence protein ComEC/Rec2 [Sporolactobacillus terrae]|uniref:DNA internalization-related competence protein ComEC/Rec2 n=1 Tax=Sporolactobacillus terrae TaxID=269673 RepID=A0ABX5Q870_9BACL|nr:DNA internalization-related competence protein ComEC/Rec2 [Sporolactobacillus terrae]QAA22852.1 DNA internalization-related competence protein ComEC/Rec2 [Sporolactobacillus terrae]QAA25826.1 DNA internalization-related competence protein ComEC/Rec2 [Sporolactobacillus terrae]UAK17702.1 DNA internalization-related competence protein ComEC/Rec2 [Sporolactobacillus terrae]
MTGKWHLAALCVCTTAWALSGRNGTVPVLLLIGYSFYLVFRRHYRMFAVFLALMLILVVDFTFVKTDKSIFSGRETQLSGRIASLPDFDGDRLRFKLKTNQGETVIVDYLLKTRVEKERLRHLIRAGQLWRAIGAMDQPMAPTNFHGFNQKQYLEQHHIYWKMNAKQLQMRSQSGYNMIGFLSRFRQDQTARIDAQFTPPSAQMMNALLFGSDQQMDPALSEAYRQFGLVHVLVVSGMHIAVVFGSLYYLFRRIGVVREYAALFLILLMPVYVFLTGAEPSVVRSGITASIVLLFSLVRRHKMPVSDPISIACLVMVFLDPNIVFDLGFQLSFAIAFVVLIAAPIVAQAYASFIVRMITLSLICELATFPIIVPNFYQMSLIGVVLGVFFVPFITFLIFPLCAIAYFASFVWADSSSFFSWAVDALLLLPHQILLKLAQIPSLQMVYGALTGWQICMSVVLIFLSLLLWEQHRNKKALLMLCTPFLMMYLVVTLTDYADPRGSVTFLDVGQGDSILIQLPHRQGSLLIDTGGTIPFEKEKWKMRRKPFEVGRDVVLNELVAQRVTHLDALVLTHSDYDHVGGLQGIVGKTAIRKLLVSPYHDPNLQEQQLFQTLSASGTAIRLLRSGMTLQVKAQAFHILSPLEDAKNSNDNSVVLYAVLGGERWLFTGDLSSSGERELMQRYPNLRADVLKLGHHGSRTSTSEAWLEQLNPAIGVISCGRANRYGHPHPEIVQALHQYDVFRLRTDRSGAIRFWFDVTKMSGFEHAYDP